MVIRILNLVEAADTTEQGLKVFAVLARAFAVSGPVIVSFDGISTATSSFVNASVVKLLDAYALIEITGRLRVTGSTRQINDMIKACLFKTRSSASVAA